MPSPFPGMDPYLERRSLWGVAHNVWIHQAADWLRGRAPIPFVAMFNQIGLPEVLIVLVIALIVFGPKRLPELGRSLGKGMREFKDSISGKGDDEESSADPPQIEDAENPDEPVEGEVVTHHRG